MTVAVGAGSILAAYAFLIEPRWIEWTQETVEIPGLPPELDGLRMIQISDTHVPRSLSSALLENVVEQSNAREPDVVALTGDLIEAGHKAIPGCAAIFGKLRSRLGVYGILGAHDLWRAPQDVERGLEANGVRMLFNEAAPVGPLEHPLWIVGLEDNSGYGAPDLERAMKDVPPGAPVVLLMHSPDSIEKVARLKIPLALAGHTHGGQVCAPFYGAIRTMSRYGRRFVSGRHRVDETTLYTCRGIGSHMGLRFLCRPEVVEFTLVRRLASEGAAIADGE